MHTYIPGSMHIPAGAGLKACVYAGTDARMYGWIDGNSSTHKSICMHTNRQTDTLKKDRRTHQRVRPLSYTDTPGHTQTPTQSHTHKHTCNRHARKTNTPLATPTPKPQPTPTQHPHHTHTHPIDPPPVHLYQQGLIKLLLPALLENRFASSSSNRRAPDPPATLRVVVSTLQLLELHAGRRVLGSQTVKLCLQLAVDMLCSGLLACTSLFALPQSVPRPCQFRLQHLCMCARAWRARARAQGGAKHARSRTRTHARTHVRARSLSHKHTSHTHTVSHTQRHTHTLTLTHTHT